MDEHTARQIRMAMHSRNAIWKANMEEGMRSLRDRNRFLEFHLRSALSEIDELLSVRRFLQEKLQECEKTELRDLMEGHIRKCTQGDCTIPGCLATRRDLAQMRPETAVRTGRAAAIGAQCCVCLDEAPVIAFFHGQTAHLCLCTSCFQEYNRDTCPLCKFAGCSVITMFTS